MFLRHTSDYTLNILDINDGERLGKIKLKNNDIKIQLNPKYRQNNLIAEVRLLLTSKPEKNWNDYWWKFVKSVNEPFSTLSDYKFQIYNQAVRLKSCGKDMFHRKVKLHPVAVRAWKKMHVAAMKQGITLEIISGFRSLDYQKQLIFNKLNKGIDISDILKVNTLPGFSEHHTGLAIDIGTDKDTILEQSFDKTEAFRWLQENAAKFGFYMSYPKNNETGIIYEPWHWCFKPKFKYDRPEIS